MGSYLSNWVTEYVERCYELVLADSWYMTNKQTDNLIQIEYVKDEVTKIFAGNSTDIFNKWLMIKKHELTIPLNQYLNSCSIILKIDRWVVVDSKGKEVTDASIGKIYDWYVPTNKSSDIFVEWLFDKKVSASMK